MLLPSKPPQIRKLHEELAPVIHQRIPIPDDLNPVFSRHQFDILLIGVVPHKESCPRVQ